MSHTIGNNYVLNALWLNRSSREVPSDIISIENLTQALSTNDLSSLIILVCSGS